MLYRANNYTTSNQFKFEVMLPTDPYDQLGNSEVKVNFQKFISSGTAITGDNPFFHKKAKARFIPIIEGDATSVVEFCQGTSLYVPTENTTGIAIEQFFALVPGVCQHAYAVNRYKYSNYYRWRMCEVELVKLSPKEYVVIILNNSYNDTKHDGQPVQWSASSIAVRYIYYGQYRTTQTAQWQTIAKTVSSAQLPWGTSLQDVRETALSAAQELRSTVVLVSYPHLTNSSLLFDVSFSYPEKGHAEALVRRACTELVQHVWNEPDWSLLVQPAIDNISYVSINTVLYFKELKDTGSEIRQLMSLLRNPRDPKEWAKLFLSQQYGTRLTVADTKELILAVRNACQKVRKSSKKFASCRSRIVEDRRFDAYFSEHRELHYKVYYRQYDNTVLKAADALWRWDILPTLGNTWDSIPLSFVVDWFIGVGDLLEAIDTTLYACLLPVVGITYSDKVTLTSNKPLVFDSWAMDLEYTQYDRRIGRTLHLPHFSLDINQGYKSNIPQLLAILVQKI